MSVGLLVSGSNERLDLRAVIGNRMIWQYEISIVRTGMNGTFCLHNRTNQLIAKVRFDSIKYSEGIDWIVVVSCKLLAIGLQQSAWPLPQRRSLVHPLT